MEVRDIAGKLVDCPFCGATLFDVPSDVRYHTMDGCDWRVLICDCGRPIRMVTRGEGKDLRVVYRERYLPEFVVETIRSRRTDLERFDDYDEAREYYFAEYERCRNSYDGMVLMHEVFGGELKEIRRVLTFNIFTEEDRCDKPSEASPYL